LSASAFYVFFQDCKSVVKIGESIYRVVRTSSSDLPMSFFYDLLLNRLIFFKPRYLTG